MGFFKELYKNASLWLRKKEEEKQQTGRRARATNWVRVYGIQEMADELKAAKKTSFRTKGGTEYVIAVRRVDDEPTNFIRVFKDDRPPKLRKRLRREARFLKQQAVASLAQKAI